MQRPTPQLPLTKKRYNKIPVQLPPGDYAGDTFTSQIRVEQDPDSDLIATFTVEEPGVEDEDINFYLVLDLSEEEITHLKGYMDIERLTGGKPVDVFKPVEVLFENPVTVPEEPEP